jgi:pentatricopeptide repeat protein
MATSQKSWLSRGSKLGLWDSPKAVAFAFCVVANIAISFVEMPEAWILEAAACCLFLGFYWWRKSVTELQAKCTDRSAASVVHAFPSTGRNGNFFQLQGQVSRFARASQPAKAEEVLREMRRQQLQPSLQIYSQVATAWVRAEDVESAEALLEEMLADGVVPDAVLVGLMVHTHATRRDLESAERWHARLAEYNMPRGHACFGRIINACAKTSNIEKALHYLEEMVTLGIQPEVITFSCLLDACANAGDLEQAKQIFKRMKCSGVELNAVPYACLGRLFASRGMFVEVERLFQDMLDKGISMNEYCVCTLLTAYGRSLPRQSERAERCFRSAVKQGIVVNGKVLAALRSATSRQVYQDLQRLANQRFEPRHSSTEEAEEEAWLHRADAHSQTLRHE